MALNIFAYREGLSERLTQAVAVYFTLRHGTEGLYFTELPMLRGNLLFIH